MPSPSPTPSLLLLPPPPSGCDKASLSAAYKPSITAAVSALQTLSTSTELTVALACPAFHDRLQGPRSALYHDVQHLLAGIYSLFTIVCSKLGAEVDTGLPGSIDARVILLDYEKSQALNEESHTPAAVTIAGPIIDLPTFAYTRRHWNLIFSVDGEKGEELLSNYLSLANKTIPPLEGHVQVVGGGVSLVQKNSETIRPHIASNTPHHVVAVGGTFDHLHAGHKLLLTATALLLQPATKTSDPARRLIIGITGDELLKNKKYGEYMKSWNQRQDDVVGFLLSVLSFTRSHQEAIQTQTFNDPGPNGRAIHTKLDASHITIECVEIQDPFGPTITDESITALVVSGETRSGGQAVNEKRKEKGWHALETFEIDVLDAEDLEQSGDKRNDFGSKISSTEIRKRKAESARTSSL